jgi:hypothetical protein
MESYRVVSGAQYVYYVTVSLKKFIKKKIGGL